MSRRIFSPYELRFLRKHRIDYGTITSDAPVEYIAGQAEFCGREFSVTADTLIPRIETEEMISLILQRQRTINTIADIGTGSGCIGITLFLELQKQKKKPYIFLSDISEKVLGIAKKNVKALVPDKGKNCFSFLISDLFHAFPQKKFDVITANLPYIPSERMKTLDTSVREYEPLGALDGGADGTEIINRFLYELPQYLAPDGLAILEIDDTHSLASFLVPEMYKKSIVKDSFGRNRFLVIET